VHSQAWVRGDYSDVVVSLSSIYSTVRDDTAPEEARDASHSVVRSTSKYWVKTEDISKVKYAILRHLPVFLQKTSTGESDSQLTNCVHLDNDQLGECRFPFQFMCVQNTGLLVPFSLITDAWALTS